MVWDRRKLEYFIDDENVTKDVLSMRIQKSISGIAHTFRFEIFIPIGESYPFKIWSDFRAEYDGNILVDGYLERPDIYYDQAGRTISIPGKSKTGHLIESTPELDERKYDKSTVVEIAEKIVKDYDVKVKRGKGSGLSKKFEKFKIDPGETGATIIKRAAKEVGIAVFTETGAEILLSEVTSEAPRGTIPSDGYRPVNGGLGGDVSMMGSVYIVHGHGAHHLLNKNKSKLSAEQKGTIEVHRPIIVTGESGSTIESLQAQAKRLAASRDGRSLRVNYVFSSWLAPDGEIWAPNRIFKLEDELMPTGEDGNLDEDMIVSDVSLANEGTGYSARVSFMRRSSFLESSGGFSI